MKKGKKILAAVALISTMGVCGGLLAACGGPSRLSAKAAFASVNDMYAFAAVSSANFYGAVSQGSAAVPTVLANTEPDDAALQLSQYLRMADGFIGGSKLPVSNETESDKADFATKITVNLTGIDQQHAYTLYYNETVPAQENRPATDDDDYEINTKINGIMVIQDKEYVLSGTKEVEQDEIEIEFTVTFSDTQKVVISQESESDELEYSYRYFSDESGTPAKTMQLEIEKEDGEIEFDLILTEGEKTIRYNIEKERDGFKAITLQDGVTQTYTIKIVEKDGIMQYEFTDTDGNKTYYSLNSTVVA